MGLKEGQRACHNLITHTHIHTAHIRYMMKCDIAIAPVFFVGLHTDNTHTQKYQSQLLS